MVFQLPGIPRKPDELQVHTGLNYVTRPDKGPHYDPATDAQNAHERLTQSIVLQGTEFDIDNTAAFHFLQYATLHTSAWTHVEAHEATRDAHATMSDIRNHYLNEECNHTTMERAALTLKTLTYSGEHNGKFETHCTTIVTAYNIQASQNQHYLDDIKVKHLHDSIQVANNTEVQMAKALMLQQYKHNFKGACTYITTRMCEISPRDSTSNTLSRTVSQITHVSTTVNGTYLPDIFNIHDDVSMVQPGQILPEKDRAHPQRVWTRWPQQMWPRWYPCRQKRAR